MVRHLTVSQKEYVLQIDRWSWDSNHKLDGINNCEPNGQIKEVRFTYTNTVKCMNRTECTPILQHILETDLGLGLHDIGYNFLVSTTGTVYEGRGWLYQPAIHPNYPPPKQHSIDIAYIGNFSVGEMPLKMYTSALNLIKYGLKMNLISPSYNIAYYRPPSRRHQLSNDNTLPEGQDAYLGDDGLSAEQGAPEVMDHPPEVFSKDTQSVVEEYTIQSQL